MRAEADSVTLPKKDSNLKTFEKMTNPAHIFVFDNYQLLGLLINKFLISSI